MMAIERTTSHLQAMAVNGGQRLRIIIHNGTGNPITSPLIGSLKTVVAEAAGEKSELKAITIEGQGADFCVGAGFQEQPRLHDTMRQLHQLLRSISDLSVPVAAIVWGRCYGAGLELCLLASWIFAHDNAEFALPLVRTGVVSPVASLLLPARIGQSRAETMCLTGRVVSAREALRWGLADDVSGDCERTFDAFAQSNLYPQTASSLRHATWAVRTRIHHALHHDLPVLEDELRRQSSGNGDGVPEKTQTRRRTGFTGA